MPFFFREKPDIYLHGGCQDQRMESDLDGSRSKRQEPIWEVKDDLSRRARSTGLPLFFLPPKCPSRKLRPAWDVAAAPWAPSIANCGFATTPAVGSNGKYGPSHGRTERCLNTGTPDGFEETPAPGAESVRRRILLMPVQAASRFSSLLACWNQIRSRRRRYPGMVGFLSRIRCAHSRASELRCCEARKLA
jgi:hypothetical protein